MTASFHDNLVATPHYTALIKNVHTVGEGIWPLGYAGNHVRNSALATPLNHTCERQARKQLRSEQVPELSPLRGTQDKRAQGIRFPADHE